MDFVALDASLLGASLTAGMLAAFNPCGFALLPAYLALFIGDTTASERPKIIRRSLSVSAAVTAGFVVVFGAVGILISVLAWQITAYTPYLTLIVGPLLVLLGIWLLTGHELNLRLPRLRGHVGATPAGMLLYGMIYATVSLSCTFPIFLLAVTGALRGSSPLAGFTVMLVYALGMGLVMTALTLAIALARTSLVARSRNMVKYVSRISGVLLVAAGAYLSWYGYIEIRLLRGADGASLPDTFVTTAISGLTTAIDRIGGPTLAVGLIAVIAVLVTAIARLNRPHPEPNLSLRAEPGQPTRPCKEVDL